MKNYSGYKFGYNSRGVAKDSQRTPEPKVPSTSCTTDQAFVHACQEATKNINLLIEEGRLPATFWNVKGGSHAGKNKAKGSQKAYMEVAPTPRQYRNWRNGHGLAWKYRNRF